MTAGCIVVAAGRGERLGAGPKAFVCLEGRTLLDWACAAARAAGIEQIVVVLPAVLSDVEASRVPADVVRAVGGTTRQQSVAAGLAALPDEADVVLVHDAARALVPPSVFTAVVDAVRGGHPAVVPGVPLTDTLRLVDPRPGEAAVHRDRLVAVQTPQGFTREALVRAHALAPASATDDAGLAELAGVPVHVVPGHDEGFKVTRPLDLLLARAVVRHRHPTSAAGPPAGTWP